jgi:DNA-binding response OmpR family regulator
MKKILYVEDDEDFADTVILDFEYYCKDCFEIKHFILGEDALKYLERNSVDLVLLDYQLPDLNGTDVLKKIRENKQHSDLIVVIHTVLTSRTKEKLLVVKYEADDYITKSTSNSVLIAKIKRMLKNKGIPRGENPFEINNDLREISFNDVYLELTPMEFDILSELVNHPDTTQSKEHLLSITHPEAKDLSFYSVKGIGNPITSHIKNIRKEIKKIDFNYDGIKTKTKKGYVLKL